MGQDTFTRFGLSEVALGVMDSEGNVVVLRAVIVSITEAAGLLPRNAPPSS